MNANKAIITGIFNGSTLIEIPFFQRSYVWNEELWQRLIDDMTYVVESKKAHFLGSIILKQGQQPVQGDKFTARYTVVDGQQRLTTFLLFLKALCLLKGEQTMFNFQFRIMGEDIALKHGKNDITAFELVTSVSAAEKVDNPHNSKIISAFNYFLEHIDVDSLDVMTVMMNAQFVRIDLDANEDEQQIFDTINSLGVNLTVSELLKNYFFSRETIKEYEEKWAAVFECDTETKAYWEKQIEAGRTKRAMIDIFFDAYFQLFIQNKKYNISAEDKTMYSRLDKISQSYQHFINKYAGGDKNVVLAQLKEYADCFRNAFRPEYCDMNLPGQFGIERINILIFGLKYTSMIPYILYVTKNISDTEELNRIYALLESYIMRRMIVRATSNNYNNLFTSLILGNIQDTESLLAHLKKGNDSNAFIPTDEDVREGVHTSKLMNLHTKGILYLIESYIRPAKSALALLGFQQYSLEHLMPKKWRNNWCGCANEEQARQRDSILLTLGNLAIIPQSLNASIRDSSWQEKKAGKGNKPGLSTCAAGLATFTDVLSTEEWNEETIASRAEWLCEKALELWKI